MMAVKNPGNRRKGSIKGCALQALLLATVTAGTSMPGMARATTLPALRTFHCGNQNRFSVLPISGGALISLPGRQLRMATRPFRLGERFAPAEGTLIIDGDFASLVLNDDLSFQACKRLR